MQSKIVKREIKVMQRIFLGYLALILFLPATVVNLYPNANSLSLVSRRVAERAAIRASQARQEERWIAGYKKRIISVETNPKGPLAVMRPLRPDDPALVVPTESFSLAGLPKIDYQGEYVSNADAVKLLDAVEKTILPQPIIDFLKAVLKGQMAMGVRVGGIAARFDRSSGLTDDVKIDDPKGFVTVYQDSNEQTLRFIDTFLLDVRAAEILAARLLHKVGIRINPESINITAVLLTSPFTHDKYVEYLRQKQASGTLFGMELGKDILIGHSGGEWRSLNPYPEDAKDAPIWGEPGTPIVLPDGTIRTSPPGHLEVITDHLFLSGLDVKLAERGIIYLPLRNVDNLGVNWASGEAWIRFGLWIASDKTVAVEASPRVGYARDGRFGKYEYTPGGNLVFTELDPKEYPIDKGGRLTMVRGVFGVTEEFALAPGYETKYPTIDDDMFFNSFTEYWRFDHLIQTILGLSLEDLREGRVDLVTKVERVEKFKSLIPIYVEMKPFYPFAETDENGIPKEGREGPKFIAAQPTQLGHSAIDIFFAGKAIALTIPRMGFIPVKSSLKKEVFGNSAIITHLNSLWQYLLRIVVEGP